MRSLCSLVCKWNYEIGADGREIGWNQAVCPYPSFSGYQNCPAQARHICATRPTRRHERDRQREEGGGCQNESERKTKPGLPPCLLSLSCTPVPPLGLVACKSLSWGGSSFGRDVDTPSGQANLDVIFLDDIKLSFATTQLLMKDHP